MAVLCAVVKRGTNMPFAVDCISNKADASGAVVPIPALPVAGNVFCANIFCPSTIRMKRNGRVIFVFIF